MLKDIFHPGNNEILNVSCNERRFFVRDSSLTKSEMIDKLCPDGDEGDFQVALDVISELEKDFTALNNLIGNKELGFLDYIKNIQMARELLKNRMEKLNN